MFCIYLSFLILTFPYITSSKTGGKCKTCKDLVSNFHKGMEKTGKNHFGGGDTAWEESRLGSYARSETRLLEILERICDGVSTESRCHAMVEEHEEQIESFWFNKHNELSKLEEHLCMQQIKVCCPAGKYGKTCKECPGGADNPCSGHGTCKGAGTRSGSGKCECDEEYQGDNCDTCNDDGYYDAGNFTCNKCDESCESSCTDGTNKGCDACKEGYDDDPDNGCVDNNECEDVSICKEGTFCFNTKGSYKCTDCDKACDGGCTGTGRINCLNCKPGWQLKQEGKGCEDINECETTDICQIGTHCKNNEGSFRCEACHRACANECTGEGPSSCNECAKGYKLTEEGCQDVDECAEYKLNCPSGQVCVNRDGPDRCEACDPSCIECTSTEPNACLQCQPGYLLQGGRCEDINECSSNPCHAQSENCHNTAGSFKCKCQKGWARTKKGDCVRKQQKGKQTSQVMENTEDLQREINEGKFLTETHLKIGSLLYAIFFAAILYLFNQSRYYSIAFLVVLHCVVIAYINILYPVTNEAPVEFPQDGGNFLSQ